MSESKAKVLIISSSPEFLQDKMKSLSSEYDCQKATTEEMALFMARQWEPHVCLVQSNDIFLGLCFSLRDQFPFAKMGLIAVGLDNLWTHEERAFRAGCDFYLAHQIEWRQLSARMALLLRRVQSGQELILTSHPEIMETKHYSFRGLEISPHDYILRRGSDRVNVTPTQFRLLVAFTSHPDQLLSREWLKEKVWDRADISTRSIDAQISKLKKIVPELEPVLVNIYGQGYILTDAQKERIAS